MKKIILERGGGKTDQLIQMSAESGDKIVCLSSEERAMIKDRAKCLGPGIPSPITFYEFIERKYIGQVFEGGGFLIDNADLLIQTLTHIPIKAITMRP